MGIAEYNQSKIHNPTLCFGVNGCAGRDAGVPKCNVKHLLGLKFPKVRPSLNNVCTEVSKILPFRNRDDTEDPYVIQHQHVTLTMVPIADKVPNSEQDGNLLNIVQNDGVTEVQKIHGRQMLTRSGTTEVKNGPKSTQKEYNLPLPFPPLRCPRRIVIQTSLIHIGYE